jgi:hypothetical protein
MTNGNPFYVQPAQIDTSLLQGIGQSLERRRDIARGERIRQEDLQREEEKRQRNLQMRSGLAQVIETNDTDAIADYVIKNPGAQQIAMKSMGLESEIEMMQAIRDVERVVIDGEDPFNVAAEGVQRKLKTGGDATRELRTAEEAAKNKEESRKKALIALAIWAPDRYKSYMASIGEDPTKLRVGSQEILEDGTIIQSTTGGPRVFSATGEQLKGQAAKDAVLEARSLKVSNLRKAAGQKKRAALEEELNLKGIVEADVISKKEAAKASVDAYRRTEPIRKNIANINEAIRLLRVEGAQTGVIDKLLPSIRAATIKLNNLQGQLGLDVIAQTTFGALSESELSFALDTAMPTGLQPEELAQWFERKRDVQEKLIDYLESAAIYLGTPGNTTKGWIEKKRNQQTLKLQTPLRTGIGQSGAQQIEEGRQLRLDEPTPMEGEGQILNYNPRTGGFE